MKQLHARTQAINKHPMNTSPLKPTAEQACPCQATNKHAINTSPSRTPNSTPTAEEEVCTAHLTACLQDTPQAVTQMCMQPAPKPPELSAPPLQCKQHERSPLLTPAQAHPTPPHPTPPLLTAPQEQGLQRWLPALSRHRLLPKQQY